MGDTKFSKIASILALVVVQLMLTQSSIALGAEIARTNVQQNLIVGGRTLGMGKICDECRLEKYAVCPGRLEGPAFGKDGALWVLGQDTKQIYRIGQDKICSPFATVPGPNGLRFHRDGRLFGTDHVRGLFSLDIKAGIVTWVETQYGDTNFHGLNDLIFDRQGGIYFTDARGSSEYVKRGQLFYRTPEGEVKLLADNLSYPNGLGLSPDEKTLYVNEWGSNRIAAFPVRSPGSIDLSYAWIFATLNGGRGPDGLTLDADGNVYVAHHSAGEILVFNPRGFLLGSIQMPEDSMVPNNLQFSGDHLYITEADQHTVWRVKTKIRGIKQFQDQ